jgi:hypothetical protein
MKPGHQKILSLFLVDPNVRVISTADVPCQRLDWWWDEMLKATSAPSPGGLHRLPPELQEVVFNNIDDSPIFPISMEKAKEYREQLMEERKKPF